MRIEAILRDNVVSTPAQNRPPFEASVDYGEFMKRQQAVLGEWKQLRDEEKSHHKGGVKSYFSQKGVEEPDDFHNSKNLHMLDNEIQARLSSSGDLDWIVLDQLDYLSSALELLENMENAEHIRSLYRIRKRTTGAEKNSGINMDESRRLKNCLRQGRELYLSSRGGPFMVKPLTLFYSLTAYAYVAIVLNNPIRFKLDNLPGSHGMNYLPESIEAQIGGDMPHGTFSDLLVAYPTNAVRTQDYEYSQSSKESIIEFYKRRVTIGTGTLLSMIPEIRDYYKIATNRDSRTHPLEINVINERRSTSWELRIGDGTIKPAAESLSQAFPAFQIGDRHGKAIVSIPRAQEYLARATIYADTRGRLWFVENPLYPIILPELCVHFLLTSIFSSIMRYSPDTWGEVLLNEVNTHVALIIRKYISAWERKMPVLLLRSISKFHPVVSSNT